MQSCLGFVFVLTLFKTFKQTLQTLLCAPFETSSLFNDVPLDETIGICASTLYRGGLLNPPFPEEVFVEMIKSATRSVEFSCNNEMYQQRDGVSMGSPLGMSLPNTFVGF